MPTTISDFMETPVMDDCVSFGITGGPSWKTDLAETDSGFDYANQLWSQAKHVYEVSYDARRPEVWDRLLDHYMAVGGRAGRFRMKDPFDFSATITQGVFQQLTPTTFQCYKQYPFGSLIHYRKIQKLYGTINVVGGTSPSVNLNTGVCTVAGGTPTAWYGDFHVPVRFFTDVMRAVIINRSLARGLIKGWTNIEIREVRIS